MHIHEQSVHAMALLSMLELRALSYKALAVAIYKGRGV